MKKVTLALDQPRELVYNINAVVELEDRFDVALPELFRPGKLGFKLVRRLVHIGLTHGGMKFKGATVADQEEACGVFLQEHWFGDNRDLQELMDGVTDALDAAGLFKKKDDDEEGESDKSENPSPGAE